jgi:type IV pilus assembly protein PilM
MSMFQNIFTNSAATHSPHLTSRVVGIDMGSSAIKIVELEDRGGVVTLVNYGEIQTGPFSEKSIGESVALSPQLEQKALLEIYQASVIKAKSAVYAMPLSSSFITVLTLLVEAEDEDIGPRVRAEARKYIPIPMNKITLDWLDLGAMPSAEEEPLKKEILVAAIQNAALEQSAALLEVIGYENVPTEIECFSAVRSLYGETKEFSAVIDIGAVFSKLYILKDGVIQRIHRARGGSALCTAQYAAENHTTFEKSEEIKRLLTDTSEVYVPYKKIYHTQMERVLKEFGKVIADYQSKNEVVISGIQLTGGGALFPHFSSFASDILQNQVTVSDPFAQVAYPAFMEDTLKAIGPTFSVALGAALRHFNE